MEITENHSQNQHTSQTAGFFVPTMDKTKHFHLAICILLILGILLALGSFHPHIIFSSQGENLGRAVIPQNLLK